MEAISLEAISLEAINILNEMKRIHDTLSLQHMIMYSNYGRDKEELDARRKELELREKEVDQGNENERKMLDNQKKQNEMDILELEKSNEHIMSRVEELNRIKEPLLKKIIELSAKLVQKQALELQVPNDNLAEFYMKRMEELDREQFMNAVKVKYGNADSEKALELCSLWEGYFRDPSWQPFKVVMEGENDKVVLDENDDKLKELENEFGEQAYEVVTNALNKFNEYFPSSGNPVPELWNTNEKKRDALIEGVARLLKEWKIQKDKWQRN